MNGPERSFHTDFDTPLEGEVFVFGSNKQGVHGAGAAKVALAFGAKMGVGSGRCGNTYAITTRNYEAGTVNSIPLLEVALAIEKFCEYTLEHPDEEYFVTGVGCGHAGFKEEMIVPLFRTAVNCTFPDTWEPFFEVADTLYMINLMVECITTPTPSNKAALGILPDRYRSLRELHPIALTRMMAKYLYAPDDQFIAARLCITKEHYTDTALAAEWHSIALEVLKNGQFPESGVSAAELILQLMLQKKPEYKSVYFMNEEAEYTFYILHLDGKDRMDKLGIARRHYIDPKYATQWYKEILGKLPSKDPETIKELDRIYQVMTYKPLEEYTLPEEDTVINLQTELNTGSKTDWLRYRVYANPDDYRPVIFPPPGPYWCSGSNDQHNILIVYLPRGIDIQKYWPEVTPDKIDFIYECPEGIKYSDRFPKPEWWTGE